MLGALVVATSAPGLAVAHGSAHLHAAEHERDHDVQHVGEIRHLVTVQETSHGTHEQLHLQTAAVTTRAFAAPFVVAAVVALTLGTVTPVAASAPSAEPVDVPDEPPPDRVTQPRAPPLG